MSKVRRFSARRPINSPPPVADKPPFWEAITPDEVFRYGRPTAFDRTAEGAGWSVARFLITSQGADPERQTVVGYVRGDLAAYIARADDQRLAFLIHLPTGFCVSRSFDDGLILFMGDIIAPHIPKDAGVPEIALAGSAYRAALENTGLRCVSANVFGQGVLVWIREGETLAQAMGLSAGSTGGGR